MSYHNGAWWYQGRKFESLRAALERAWSGKGGNEHAV